MEVTTLKVKLDEVFEKSKMNNNSFLDSKRSEAFIKFKNTGFPHIKNEEWKYTNLSNLLKEELNIATNSVLTAKDIEQYLYPIDADILVFVNGTYNKELSKINSSNNFECSELSNVDNKEIEKYFARKSYSAEDGLSLLNTAFSKNGLLIRFKKNKSSDIPLIIYHFTDCRIEHTLSQPRILVVAEENSQSALVEVYHTLGENIGFTNTITEVILHKDAHFDYYKIQDDGSNGYHVGSTEIVHEAKSTSSSTTITLGGAITRNNLNITLEAEHCEAYLNGLYILNKDMHVDNHTIADHAKPNCYSNELYKGIMDDKSTGVFNGKIFVKQDAQKTNAFQSNKNILLSKEASVNTKPQLEIFADDVKCSHGATTGQLDNESLFYLRSRGIEENQAKRLLLHAFANDVLERMKLTSLKNLLFEKIETRLS